MDSKKLLPCPMCGCKYISPIGRNPRIETDTYGNFCEGCGLNLFGFGSQDEADDAWNTREEGTCVFAVYGTNDTCDGYYCSNCGEIRYKDMSELSNISYCPKCGAKVIKE